jgi:hypothetical protein
MTNPARSWAILLEIVGLIFSVMHRLCGTIAPFMQTQVQIPRDVYFASCYQFG